MANKYVVLRKPGGELQFRMSKSVEYHRELVQGGYECLGGGRFYVNQEDKEIILYDKSDDYGEASKQDIIQAINNTMLSGALQGYGFYITRASLASQALQLVSGEQPDLIYQH